MLLVASKSLKSCQVRYVVTGSHNQTAVLPPPLSHRTAFVSDELPMCIFANLQGFDRHFEQQCEPS